MDEQLLNDMLSAIKKQMNSKQWQDKQFIPNPATWLNQCRWEDEIDGGIVDDRGAITEDGTFKF